jgi:26S proteasome non-ATPase regulatory subunit 9
MVVDTLSQNDDVHTHEQHTTRNIVKTLMDQKRALEVELDAIADTLSSESFSGVGLTKPLVDEEGFPLSGIDLVQVRSYRNRAAVIQTDLTAITLRIEELIHEIHREARESGSVSSGARVNLIPFGRVDMVVPGSAAESAGILVGDKIIKFGRLSCINVDGVQACFDSIPQVIQDLEVNKPMDIEVSRVGRKDERILIPVILSDDGRLGCLIRPVI